MRLTTSTRSLSPPKVPTYVIAVHHSSLLDTCPGEDRRMAEGHSSGTNRLNIADHSDGAQTRSNRSLGGARPSPKGTSRRRFRSSPISRPTQVRGHKALNSQAFVSGVTVEELVPHKLLGSLRSSDPVRACRVGNNSSPQGAKPLANTGENHRVFAPRGDMEQAVDHRDRIHMTPQEVRGADVQRGSSSAQAAPGRNLNIRH